MVSAGRWLIHPHPFFEVLGILVAAAMAWDERRRLGDPVGPRARTAIGLAAVVGGFAGAVGLGLVDARLTGLPSHEGSRSAVGGVLGGLLGVEGMKRVLGVRVSTGDRFALPLVAGLAIGRVGCFLTGLADRTHGIGTALPWGVDFGDGVMRHPTQVYEIAWLLATALAIALHRPRRPVAGDRFRIFMIAYLAFRLTADFLRPGNPVHGMTTIQWACAVGLAWYARHVARIARPAFR